jgi:hypothetical protein
MCVAGKALEHRLRSRQPIVIATAATVASASFARRIAPLRVLAGWAKCGPKPVAVHRFYRLSTRPHSPRRLSAGARAGRHIGADGIDGARRFRKGPRARPLAGHPVRQPHPTRRRHASLDHDHHPHPTAVAGLRTTRRHPPPWPGVVSTPTPANRKTPGQRPNPSKQQGELRSSARLQVVVQRELLPGLLNGLAVLRTQQTCWSEP